jgi:hypothetical protein
MNFLNSNGMFWNRLDKEKNIVNDLRPLFKFKQIILKVPRNLARNIIHLSFGRELL